jgi:protein phosphatase
VKAIGDTHIGMVRSANQDCFRIGSLFGQTNYVVVCDGMGGENGGGIASRMAADSIETALLRAASGGMPETSLRAALLCAVQGANSVVYEYAKRSPDLTGMGTTVIAAAVRSGLVCAAYAGDSRIYSVLDGRLVQLTRDHTVVQVLLEKGEISPEDAKHHPQRHYITRALGISAALDADYIEHPLRPEELILFCTDGLYNFLSPGELLELSVKARQRQDVSPLIDRANQNGGGDNVTAVLVWQSGEGGLDG